MMRGRASVRQDSTRDNKRHANTSEPGTLKSWVIVKLTGWAQQDKMTESSTRVRILVADDHDVVRHGLRALLKDRPEWEVVDEAADGLEALEKAELLNPDVVVLDISMPRMNGLEASRHIRNRLPNCEVLIVTQHDSAHMAHEAWVAGASGYVVKSNVARDLEQAVEALSQHKTFTAPGGNKYAGTR